MTFKQFLLEGKPGFDKKGDLKRLARSDKNIPDVKTLSELLTYLNIVGYSASMSDAAATGWKDYETAERKMRRNTV